MTGQLIYYQPCEHGHYCPHPTGPTHPCPGGTDTILDPDKCLLGYG